MGRRIGILGGSFDPVHEAHLALARSAIDALALDLLKWIPAGQPWQKAGRQLAPAADRLAMLALATAGLPRHEIDDCEIAREGATYTVETLEHLRAGEPGAAWFLVVGQDQWARFDSWHRWQDILRMATVAVAGRAGEAPRAPAAVAALAPAVEHVPLPPMDVSATAIRARIAAGLPPGDAVPDAVARYIDRHHLYRTRS